MKYVVTGAAGFVGTHLCKRLAADGHEVVAVDQNKAAITKLLQTNLEVDGFCAVIGDWENDVRLASEISKSDGVFHLASTVGVFNVLKAPTACLWNIVNSTLHVVRLCLNHEVPLLLTSSSEAYGLGKPDQSPLSETDSCTFGPSTEARWCYGIAKLAAEHIVLDCVRHGLPAVVVRLFNTVGPGQPGDGGMVIPRFVKAALAGESLKVFGDGGQVRTFCHVRDTVDCLVKLMERVRDFSGEVFNVGSEEFSSIEYIAHKVIEVLRSKSRIQRVIYDKAYPQGGFAEMPWRCPSVEKVYRAIGWKATAGLEEIIADTAQALKGSAAEEAA